MTTLTPIDTASIGTIVVAMASGVLAVITYFYMRETRLMRMSGEKPSFSLEPIDFKRYLDDDTKVAYQFNYLGNIVETLDEIRKEFRDVDKSLL